MLEDLKKGYFGDGWGQKLLSSPKVTVFRGFHRASLDTRCTLVFTIEGVINQNTLSSNSVEVGSSNLFPSNC